MTILLKKKKIAIKCLYFYKKTKKFNIKTESKLSSKNDKKFNCNYYYLVFCGNRYKYTEVRKNKLKSDFFLAQS